MKSLILHLANLSKLTFNKEELKSLEDDFKEILPLMQHVCDFKDNENSIVENTCDLRDDCVCETNFSIRNPKVPRVIT